MAKSCLYSKYFSTSISYAITALIRGCAPEQPISKHHRLFFFCFFFFDEFMDFQIKLEFLFVNQCRLICCLIIWFLDFTLLRGWNKKERKNNPSKYFALGFADTVWWNWNNATFCLLQEQLMQIQNRLQRRNTLYHYTNMLISLF